MWYEDLTECDYFGKGFAKVFTAVGWIENGKTFATGEILPNVCKKLDEFSKSPLYFAVYRGFHFCDICKSREARGHSNIFIPGKGKIYVCPELILHYIKVHAYNPPKEFQDAVINCPPVRSMDYRLKMLENIIRKLIKILLNK